MTETLTGQPTSDLYRALLELCLVQPAELEFSAQQKQLFEPLLAEKLAVLLAFPPKCGGFFARELVGAVLSCRTTPPTPTTLVRGSLLGTGNGGQDLHLPELVAFFGIRKHVVGIMHRHMIATDPNLALVNLFGLRPVVMKRNLLDMLRSMLELSVKRRSVDNYMTPAADGELFLGLSEDERKDYFIDQVGPWYVRFYASWFRAARNSCAGDVLWLTYGELKDDPVGMGSKIFEHLGIPVDRRVIALGVEHCMKLKSNLNFNRGVAGRGGAYFSEEQRERLLTVAQRYSPECFVQHGLL